MPASHLTQQVRAAFPKGLPECLGIAVSGGGDSMALLHVLQGLCLDGSLHLQAVTVDHGLRPEAADEAAQVAKACGSLGIPHETLVWDGWDGSGNLQNAAREARFALIAAWAARQGIGTVALGHTADDQAETLLMRLAREAGVDGLSGIPKRTTRHGILWVRPLLHVRRAQLRAYLTAKAVTWSEDPSNEDTGFERIKARQALGALEGLGIDAAGLATVAEQMQQAKNALNWQTFLAAKDLARIEAGAVALCARKLKTLPDEIIRRLLVRAIQWINGAVYAPRRGAVANLIAAVKEDTGGTAEGVQLHCQGGRVWMFRELNAVAQTVSPLSEPWDGRWLVSHPRGAVDSGTTVRALGDAGLLHCPDWRETGLPRGAAMATPAVWRGESLLAAPVLKPQMGWQAKLKGGEDSFFAALLSH